MKVTITWDVKDVRHQFKDDARVEKMTDEEIKDRLDDMYDLMYDSAKDTHWMIIHDWFLND